MRRTHIDSRLPSYLLAVTFGIVLLTIGDQRPPGEPPTVPHGAGVRQFGGRSILRGSTVTRTTRDEHPFGSSPVVRDGDSVPAGNAAGVPGLGRGRLRPGPVLGTSASVPAAFVTVGVGERDASRSGESVRRPNELLRRARVRLTSPSGSGRPMSRQELADAVNAVLHPMGPRAGMVDARWVAGLEQGRARWPRAHARQALRQVLGAATDAQLGLFVNRRMDDVSVGGPEVDPWPAVSSRGWPLPVGSGDGVRVVVPAGATITVRGVDGQACEVAIEAAGVVTSLVCGPGPGSADRLPVGRPLLLVVGAEPMTVGGARVYPVAQRRWTR